MTSTPRIIEITVDPAGKTKLETRGFAGPSCRDASRGLERVLGLVESDQPTAEMHQVQPEQIDEQA